MKGLPAHGVHGPELETGVKGVRGGCRKEILKLRALTTPQNAGNVKPEMEAVTHAGCR